MGDKNDSETVGFCFYLQTENIDAVIALAIQQGFVDANGQMEWENFTLLELRQAAHRLNRDAAPGENGVIAAMMEAIP